MSFEAVSAWVSRHYTWPVVFALVLVATLAPVSRPVVGVLMLAAGAVLIADLLRRTGRAFRDGYRGSDQSDT